MNLSFLFVTSAPIPSVSSQYSFLVVTSSTPVTSFILFSNVGTFFISFFSLSLSAPLFGIASSLDISGLCAYLLVYARCTPSSSVDISWKNLAFLPASVLFDKFIITIAASIITTIIVITSDIKLTPLSFVFFIYLHLIFVV